MRTNIVEVSGMLSALSARGVEKQLARMRGVKKVEVNYVAGSATVTYDETRLEIADIKSAVRQSGYQSAGESLPKHVSEHKPARKGAVVPTREAAPASASTHVAGVSKASTVALAAVPRAGRSRSRRPQGRHSAGRAAFTPIRHGEGKQTR